MRHVKAENPSKGAIYTLRVDRVPLDKLRAIALAEHRSLSGKLRAMIDEEIARHQPDGREVDVA